MPARSAGPPARPAACSPRRGPRRTAGSIRSRGGSAAPSRTPQVGRVWAAWPCAFALSRLAEHSGAAATSSTSVWEMLCEPPRPRNRCTDPHPDTTRPRRPAPPAEGRPPPATCNARLLPRLLSGQAGCGRSMTASITSRAHASRLFVPDGRSAHGARCCRGQSHENRTHGRLDDAAGVEPVEPHLRRVGLASTGRSGRTCPGG